MLLYLEYVLRYLWYSEAMFTMSVEDSWDKIVDMFTMITGSDTRDIPLDEKLADKIARC